MNLKQLLGICEHKWKEVERYQIESVGVNTGRIKKEWQKILMQCEKCGDIKLWELYTLKP